MSDRRLLYAVATLRAVASAATGVTLGAYLKQLGHGASTVGFVTSAGLAGSALAMLLVTVRADRTGRRRSLLLAALVVVSGSVVLLLPAPVALVVAAALLALWRVLRHGGRAAAVQQPALP